MSLPHRFRVRLAPGVDAADGGRLLVGGSPLTALRLSDRARAMIGPDGLVVSDAATGQVADRLIQTNLGVPDLTDQPRASAGNLTVVIPVRDRPHQLDRALTALEPLRCIVVDDASSDPASIAAVAATHHATLLHLDANVGPAGARNAGLAQVRSTYVAFVDSDVEIYSSDLLALTRHFQDRSVALVGPRVTGIARSVEPRWLERYDAVASSLTLGRVPANVRPGAAVAWLPSACLVARRDLIGDGFDESMRVGEDVDLVWRLLAQGHRVRYDPDVEARHDARTTLREWLGRKAYYGSGGARLAARHGDHLAPAILTPTFAAAAAALLVRRGWSVPAAVVAVLLATRSVAAKLPSTPGRTALAGRLSVGGLGWAVRQESALLLRHWWPATVVGAALSATVRRAVLTALVVDSVVALAERRQNRSGLRPLEVIAGRRLDDLAYGAGLWWGALRLRSVRVLAPRRPARDR